MGCEYLKCSRHGFLNSQVLGGTWRNYFPAALPISEAPFLDPLAAVPGIASQHCGCCADVKLSDV